MTRKIHPSLSLPEGEGGNTENFGSSFPSPSGRGQRGGVALKRAFTLIELMVVIAIIGVLTAVSMVNIKASRDKGDDARIKSLLSQIKATIEIESQDGIYGYLGSTSCEKPDSRNTSTSMFNTSPVIRGYFDEIKKVLSVPSFTTSNSQCVSAPGNYTTTYPSYAIILKLKSGKFVCVDSTDSKGEMKEYFTQPTIVQTGGGSPKERVYSCPD